MVGTIDRLAVRRHVQYHLRRVREYRRLIARYEGAETRRGFNRREVRQAYKWTALADALLESLPTAQAQFARWLYNLDNIRHTYSRNDAFAKAEIQFGLSEDALKRWREIIIYNASVMAAMRGLIDVSCVQ